MEIENGVSLSPGEFKHVIDAIENWPVLITFHEVNGHALKFSTESIDFEVLLTYFVEDKYLPELRECRWQGGKDLKAIASMIDKDTLFWENRKRDIEYQMDKYESFIGRMKKEDWKRKQQLWIEDKEYRDLSDRLDLADSHIENFGVIISTDKLEFYYGNDHDLCIVTCSR